MINETVIATLITSLVVSIVINMAMFVVAFILRSDKLTDISYAVTFVVIALVSFLQTELSWYFTILFGMVAVWASRLGGFLLYRVIKTGKDSRFDGMRENFFKFAKFWIAQALTVWILMIPFVLAFNSSRTVESITFIGILGCIVWLVGFISETTADIQKMIFTSSPKNKGNWISSGLWAYSRHPNYFGEILIWVGIYLFVFSILTPLQTVIGLVSPAFIMTLLLFVSGIPILEKSADKKWGDDKEYQEYKKRTSVLVPLPHRK